MKKAISRIWKRCRDAISGKFVTRRFADNHPEITVCETVEKKP